MYPKTDIQKLNRRRELERRYRFVRKRMPEVALEYHYALGKIKTLPKGMKQPPKWAIDAALWIVNKCIKPPTEEEVATDIGGVWDDMVSRYEALVAYVFEV